MELFKHAALQKNGRASITFAVKPTKTIP